MTGALIGREDPLRGKDGHVIMAEEIEVRPLRAKEC